jgi:hypothetical protein
MDADDQGLVRDIRTAQIVRDIKSKRKYQ